MLVWDLLHQDLVLDVLGCYLMGLLLPLCSCLSPLWDWLAHSLLLASRCEYLDGIKHTNTNTNKIEQILDKLIR